MAAVARYLADTSALARLRHSPVAAVLVPLIEAGLVATCGVIEFELGWATRAGADDPAHAAGRVSVIASVGYCAFLGGPPLIGFLGGHTTVRHALICVAVLLAVATAIAAALRPLHIGSRGQA